MPSFSTQNRQQRSNFDDSQTQRHLDRQPQQNQREYPPLKLTDLMPFGKFKSCLIKAIIDKKSENPIYDGGTYIQWCLENIDTFTLDEQAQQYFEEHHEIRELKKSSERRRYGTGARNT